MRILELFELEEWCFLFSLLISLDIIQGPPLVACSNLLVLFDPEKLFTSVSPPLTLLRYSNYAQAIFFFF